MTTKEFLRVMSESKLIVTPALNEAATICTVVKEVLSAGHQILVVDDGSSDETALLAAQAGAKVLQLPFNLGVGGALRVGCRFAIENGFSSVIQIDADGQHPVSHIDDLVAASESSGSHLVIGSRFASDTAGTMQVSRPRRFAMNILAKTASQACGIKLTDATSGFRLIREPLLSEFAKKLPLYYLGDTFEALVAAGKAGYSVAEIPAPIVDREYGRSSASTIEALQWTFRAFSSSVFNLYPAFDAPDHK